MADLRGYMSVTGAYWGFTLTDGALRMLVLLHFHQLGYTPFQLAFLFLLYEFFGVVTNLVGGWIGARFGLQKTLFTGLTLQIGALLLLSQLDPSWSVTFSVGYVVVAQGLAGIAKDLTKMSAKSGVKLATPQDSHSKLFHWVALLTGSKNALKGIGFFLGAFLLQVMGFSLGLIILAVSLALILVAVKLYLPSGLTASQPGLPFHRMLSKDQRVNLLSGARFFLFSARDVWFVVGVPVFLYDVLDWSFMQVGAFLAIWVVGYGFVQSVAPRIVGQSEDGQSQEVSAARFWAFGLSAIPAVLSIFVLIVMNSDGTFDEAIVPLLAWIIVVGLLLFGVVFAVNSSVHSYLILAFSADRDVSLNVGFYYMSNAAGRLLGTLLSGWLYQGWGVVGCLSVAALLAAVSGTIVILLEARTRKRNLDTSKASQS